MSGSSFLCTLSVAPDPGGSWSAGELRGTLQQQARPHCPLYTQLCAACSGHGLEQNDQEFMIW